MQCAPRPRLIRTIICLACDCASILRQRRAGSALRVQKHTLTWLSRRVSTLRLSARPSLNSDFLVRAGRPSVWRATAFHSPAPLGHTDNDASFFSAVSLAHPSRGTVALRPRKGPGHLGGLMG